MKISLVLCFVALICTSTFVDASHKHKPLTLEHLTQTLMELRSQGYTVDRVVQLLNAILNVQQSDLATLIDNWNAAAQSFIDSINGLQALADDQAAQCTLISTRITLDENQIAMYSKYIDSAQSSLHRNI